MADQEEDRVVMPSFCSLGVLLGTRRGLQGSPSLRLPEEGIDEGICPLSPAPGVLLGEREGHR